MVCCVIFRAIFSWYVQSYAAAVLHIVFLTYRLTHSYESMLQEFDTQMV